MWQKLKSFIWDRSGDVALFGLLCQQTENAEVAEQMQWLGHIVSWLLHGRQRGTETRIKYLTETLAKNPGWEANLKATVLNILNRCSFLTLFTQLPIEHGLWSDIASRVASKFVPRISNDEFLEIVNRVFRKAEHTDKLKSISLNDLNQLQNIFRSAKIDLAWLGPVQELQEAMLALTIHIAHLGTNIESSDRNFSRKPISELSFFRLTKAFQTQERSPISHLLGECALDIQKVYQRMETGGVSVALVNRLETMTALINRLDQLQKVESDRGNPQRLRDFLASAAEANLRSSSIVGHLKAHLHLLSKKIVERNGNSGDHYIARNSVENRGLFVSALAGGAVVVVMTICKTAFLHLEPAPLFRAVGISIIYASGFLLMQLGGFTLATKIPSFTASRLATLLASVRTVELPEFQKEIRLVFKSQAIALVGNLAAVIPLAIGLHCLAAWLFGPNFLMKPHYAAHFLSSLHPVLSFALPLAALTGVQLWLSSLAGGWFENWIVFNRIPEAIRQHYRLRKIFGPETVDRLVNFTLTQSSGIATNLSLGLLFGFVPLFGSLVGLDWNGHHVTISTATAAFAVAATASPLAISTWISIVIGLTLIGFLNFFVSFGLALYIASNAQRLPFYRVLKHFRLRA